MRRPEPHSPREVNCPAQNIVIDGFVDGHALTGQQCFIGGCFVVAGMLVMAYNVIKTVRAKQGTLEPIAEAA